MKIPTQAPVWRLDVLDAVGVARDLETALEPVGFHVGLTGGVLYRGASGKDLDLIVYPHTRLGVPVAPDSRAKAVLRKLGYRFVRDGKGQEYGDHKRVEIWEHPSGRRVDLFWLS